MNVTRRLEALRSLSATAAMPKDNQEIPTPDAPDEDENETTKSKKKDKDMTTVTKEEHDTAVSKAFADGEAKGKQETQSRTDAVMASEHYAGREPLAKTLMATSLSAEEIGKALAAAPKIEPSALTVEIDTEAVQRQVMTDAIAKNANSAVEVGNGEQSAVTDAAAIDAAWDKAVKRVSPAK